MTTKRERATPMSPGDRRQTIIDAVGPLLAQHGSAVTTKQIAEAAGIAEGTIFRVFDDKRALLIATATETMNPASAKDEMRDRLAEIPDLHGKIAAAVDHLVERMDKVMVVMMALRTILMTEGPGEHKLDAPGPPAFIVESNRILIVGLTEYLFEPHRDELRMAPDRAAVLLRSLVFGTRHPGMDAHYTLTKDEIVDAVLHGVAAHQQRGG